MSRSHGAAVEKQTNKQKKALACQRRISSEDRQLDVALRVVLQQRWHPRSAVAATQHALFDAGRLDLADEALQRLQAAAAERRRVGQAGGRQAAAEVWVVGLGV